MYFNLFLRPHRGELKMQMYELQRKVGHDLGFKSTIFLGMDFLKDPEMVEKCKYDRDTYGDEIAVWLTSDGKAGGGQVWLIRKEDKKRVVKNAIDAYIDAFGHAPKSVGNYVMDADLIEVVKDYCPEVEACVAGCFEEGVKVFHGCNNSWYLFSEGMSWGPWYPSKTHSIRPAKNEDDWSGVVAVPHLSRDLVLGYENRNDFFASHPANAQRGLANDGYNHDYDFNLCDQYRMQQDFNDGMSYYQMHVSPGWLSRNFNIIDPDEITQKLYLETLEYIAELRDKGEIEAVTFSEFASEYKKATPIGKATVGFAKDILMGSGKQYYWIFDPSYRVLIDTFQGGSIGDLRAYAGEYAAVTGPDAKNGRYHYNTYPYIIQSQYRTGYKTHSQDGSRTTLIMTHGNENLDMCDYNTTVESISRTETNSQLILKPVDVEFSDGFTVKLQTVYDFENGGDILITRRVIEMSDDSADFKVQEYVKASYGFTEYAEDMKDITLYCDGEKVIDYTYRNTEFKKQGGGYVAAVIPDITTEVKLCPQSQADTVSVKEGNLFGPFFTLKVDYNITNDTKEVKTWLRLSKTQA